jgi:hypothetical protein
MTKISQWDWKKQTAKIGDRGSAKVISQEDKRKPRARRRRKTLLIAGR